jgi:hypothetical protein
MSDLTSLAPCPFPQCGSSRVVMKGSFGLPSSYWVHCKDCEATGPKTPTIEEAAARWNGVLVRGRADGLELAADSVSVVSMNGDQRAVIRARNAIYETRDRLESA